MGRITGIRKQLSKELGFVVPLVKVTDDLSLPGNCYRISVAGVIVGEDEVYPNEMLALVSRSEEHTSELQSLMRISYAVFCLKTNRTIMCTTQPIYSAYLVPHLSAPQL